MMDRKQQQLSQPELPGDGDDSSGGGKGDQDCNRGSGSRGKGSPKPQGGKRGGQGVRKSGRLGRSTGPTDAIEVRNP